MRSLAAVLLAAAAAAATPASDEPSRGDPVYATVEVHGRVILDTFSTRAGLPAVTFDHWRHRLLYTCRVCHVDLAFAMKVGETQITAAGNEGGAHCGACHDGKRRQDGIPIFPACYGWPRADAARGCTRCHTGSGRGPGSGYEELKRTLPTDVAGDIDWAAAGRRGLVRPADAVEGITLRRSPIKIDRDIDIRPSGTWMSDVVFSHRKHVSWLGCELCHPDVFPVTRRGAVRYGMADLRAGRACGACHLTVAFPLATCRRCHVGEDRRAVR